MKTALASAVSAPSRTGYCRAATPTSAEQYQVIALGSYKLKSGKVERPGGHDEGAARDRACFVPGVSRSFGGKHLAA